MEKKTSCGKKLSKRMITIIIVAVVALALIAGACCFIFGARGDNPGSLSLRASLKKWTNQWLEGDESALSDGMIFGASRGGGSSADDDENVVLSAEELKTIMEEQYGELIEEKEDAESTESLFPIIMKHTSVSYKLPSRIGDGQTVTFEITGPDMAKIVGLLDENAAQAELFSRLKDILTSDNFEKRTVTAQAWIQTLDDGYKLDSSFELLDGLYGGLLSIVSEALPDAAAK